MCAHTRGGQGGTGGDRGGQGAGRGDMGEDWGWGTGGHGGGLQIGKFRSYLHMSRGEGIEEKISRGISSEGGIFWTGKRECEKEKRMGKEGGEGEEMERRRRG